MKWQASTPSNIALIKYMGKTDHTKNQATNASLSYTLNHLKTFIELEACDNLNDNWEPLVQTGLQPIKLNNKAITRYLAHLAFLKKQFNCQQNFIVRSANNFPADCGLASSASSFAALTQVACQALSELTQQPMPDVLTLAQLSRQGSGSSCRSFYSPWALWQGDEISEIKLPFNNLHHIVVITESNAKKVSSSQAHQLVKTSLLFADRMQRAQTRLDALLKSSDWTTWFNVVWQEFWDMHALFETSETPFGYMTPGSLNIINAMRQLWQTQGDGPLVTMDAGPNVHLLFRQDQTQLYQQLNEGLAKQFNIVGYQA